MKHIYKQGDKKVHKVVVTEADTAAFESGQVHPVYATFALARDAEWACRLFVLEMKEPHEEGIGISLSIEHRSPALIGEEVDFTATVKSSQGNTIICTWQARVGQRLIAQGEQGQKILTKQKIASLFNSIEGAKD